MLVSSLYPRFRDTAIIWAVLVTVLFYGTPVLYPIEVVPETLRQIIMMNPLASVFELGRVWVIDPEAPGPADAAGGFALLLVPIAIYIGICVFERVGLQPRGAPNRRAALGRAVFDSWLTGYYDDVLAPLDDACRRGEPLDLGKLRDLDDDAWTLLATKEYSVYPHLRAALPDLPDDATQETWNGRSGFHLAVQSAGFLKTLKRLYARHGSRPLADSTVLDFGCGWGRLTRLVARDVAPGGLYGCDPYPGILDVCDRMRVPARLAPIAYVPTALPFDDRFDLVYAFSVFTHLSRKPISPACAPSMPGSPRMGS